MHKDIINVFDFEKCELYVKNEYIKIYFTFLSTLKVIKHIQSHSCTCHNINCS